MTDINVRLGNLGDVDDAVSVYERSNLVRRQGDWPSWPARVATVRSRLHDAALHDALWFLIGRDGGEAVAMALIQPFRASGGSGDVIPGMLFLRLPYRGAVCLKKETCRLFHAILSVPGSDSYDRVRTGARQPNPETGSAQA